MTTIATKLEESKGEVVLVFVKGGMALEGKVVEVSPNAVTLELKANTERSAFSAGNDLRKITVIHSTIEMDQVVRVDKMATVS